MCFPVREEPDFLTVRGGSVYFTTETGEELDITGQFSEAEPYVYSYTASDGSAHDIVIGGSLEDYGYMEYVYDASGTLCRQRRHPPHRLRLRQQPPVAHRL